MLNNITKINLRQKLTPNINNRRRKRSKVVHAIKKVNKYTKQGKKYTIDKIQTEMFSFILYQYQPNPQTRQKQCNSNY